MEDIRDGYTLLRELYRQAWLRDDRPYWLQTNLDRYDQSAQLWIGRGDRWQSHVIQHWYDTRTLPTPEEAGLPDASAAAAPQPAEKPAKKPWWRRG
jgi:hypothetical protein